ncbi:MAG TPA: DNA polymerase III subunit beta [Thermomicrobiales bacterium]|nr:DNA polymerase III subunit beta [Thermomicrobiales bacterium]
MKVSCLQDQLQRGIAQVSRAVASKTALPVLSNVLLASDEGRLRIAATNLEIGITTWIEASIQEEGRTTVDARLLNEFVNTLPSGPVELSVESSKTALTVKSGRDTAAINGIDAEDFPVIPSLDAEAAAFSTELDPQVLREMISQVEFAAATDESRPVLAGVLLRFQGEAVTMAAADGFRMAVRTGSLASSVEETLDTIVPAKAFRELARIIGDQTDPVRLAITPSRGQLVFRVGETELLSRLIDGAFPDVMQIVPREFNTTVELGREPFLNAVRRASYFARDNNDVVRLTVHPGDDELEPGSVEISANAAERGTSQSFVDATITGTKTDIAFNARYLVDVLGVLRHGQIQLGFNGANQAGVIKLAGDERYDHVIMPMVIGST